MMFIRSTNVNTNIFLYFERKIVIYVINFIKKNSKIFKIKRDENIL